MSKYIYENLKVGYARGVRKTIRGRILEMLAGHPGSSTVEIARSLGMESAAIRHHLSILVSDGRVRRLPSAPGPRRGRPSLRFRLSDRLLGSNLAMLAASLLAAGNRGGKLPTGHQVLDILTRALTDQMGPMEVRQTGPQRLTALVRGLDALHYHARWEAGAEGPRLIFGHCPYAEVIADHPELCQMDARAASSLLNASARQVAKIDPSGRGAVQCMFVFK